MLQCWEKCPQDARCLSPGGYHQRDPENVINNQHIVNGKEKKNGSCQGKRPSVLGLDLGVQCLDGALLLLYLVSHLLNLLVSHVDTENENISFSQELHSACYY